MIRIIATGSLKEKLINMTVWELEKYCHRQRMGVTIHGEDVVLEYD